MQTDKKTKPSIRIGTSGYSFKDWVGEFYPAGTKSQGMLEFYAEQFDCVEVNFTYYRMPTARTMNGMANKTPDGFLFWVKAHQSATHEGDLSGTPEFLNAVAPMVEAGKLAGLLFQFPQQFKNTQPNRSYLSRLSGAFGDMKLAVEFRDRSWDRPPVYDFLEANRLNFVSVDEPDVSTLFPRVGLATGDVGYVRYHSRNAEKWYRGSAERYDYNYSDAELLEWLPKLEEISNRAKSLFLFFNNCHRGQAAANAKAMQKILQQSTLW